MYAYDSFTFTLEGHEFTATLHYDQDMGPPWKEHDGHGEVSEWMSRDKRAGELVLSSDRGSKRFYDFAGAVALARKDGWGLTPDDKAKLATELGREPKAGDIAHAAAMVDFQRLQDWCEDRWHWCGIVVTDETGETASLWGIESDSPDYHQEVARELASELLDTIKAAERATELVALGL